MIVKAILNIIKYYIQEGRSNELKSELLVDIISNPIKHIRIIISTITNESPCLDDCEKQEAELEDKEKSDHKLMLEFNKLMEIRIDDEQFPELKFNDKGKMVNVS